MEPSLFITLCTIADALDRRARDLAPGPLTALGGPRSPASPP